jgi:hypothetical protein
VNIGKYFPSSRILSAIRYAHSSAEFVCAVAANGELAAMKGRAVEPVNKVIILPVGVDISLPEYKAKS